MRPQRHTAMAMMVMELSVTQHILQLDQAVSSLSLKIDGLLKLK